MVYHAGDMEGNLVLQDIGQWLTPESLPGWIAALIMAAALVYQWYRRRPRPSKIVVFEANRTLFGKLPEVKRRLSIAFNGQEIESLAMIDLVVRNEGASTIENIDFTVEVNEQARILAIEPQPLPPAVAMTTGYTQSDPNRWEVSMDYLNPVSLGEEQVRLTVFCAPEPDAIEVRGGGKGWSSEFLTKAEVKARKRKAELAVVPVGIALFPLAILCLLGITSLLDYFFPGWRDQSWGGIAGLVMISATTLAFFSQLQPYLGGYLPTLTSIPHSPAGALD